MLMNKPIFTGAATAIVTPLTAEGVDYPAFARLIEWQIAEGIAAIVVAGTTGEGSTLSDEEHRACIDFAVKQVAGRVPVIAGTGSNDTAYAVDLSRHACAAGADALLVISPYYNKATQKGLYKNFIEIAEATDKPIILYNVPSRTGCNILPATCAALAEHPRIVAIKEACGDLSQIADTARLVQGKMDIYSGNDDQVLPILSLGGRGVISVLSNVLPAKTQAMVDRWFAGDVAGSTAMQLELLPLIHALFSEVNPIPAKAAMAAMGFCEDYLRMPLTPMEDNHRAVLYDEMRAQGINI